jgi:predicted nucleic acid-binding protein
MNPPSVFLDTSFLVAVESTGDEHHDEAVARYAEMIEEFVEQRCLLVARADHLAARENRDLFAPVDKLYVARQQRNAAAEVAARTGLPIDEAITLVLLHRNRIRKVASFDERLADYDTDQKASLPPHDAAADTSVDSAATHLATESS